MQTQTLHFSRPLTSVFFKDASHDDLKWTINYLMSLLENPENIDKSAISAHDFYGIWKDNSYDCQEMIDDIKKNRSFQNDIVEL